ncbi:MAG: TlpA family protein disulfide reductase [Lewinellaceae bacterium]|nr:TlpA family protein disulfide reductase [Lewinellaceae bacterium]
MVLFFPEYQSYLRADIRGPDMDGEWVVTSKENYRVRFRAKAGKTYRFTPMNEKPLADLSGNWATLFGTETQTPEKAIGEFKQEGNHLSGTFRTETGDYRFLEGTVQGRKFWLSCFDGSHAFLFSGSIKGDTLQGEFKSGTHYRTLWTAWRDPNFALGNPDSLTALKPTAGPLAFDLPNTAGGNLRYPSGYFDGKIRLFTIMGTWCPNCRDEQVFLKDYLEKHPEQAKKMAVVGFGFERDKDPSAAIAHLAAYKKRLGIPFDLVYAGEANTSTAERVFPMLSKVSSFPTMIIIDQQNKVRHIHTGFDGPATSRYETFRKDFESLMLELTQE